MALLFTNNATCSLASGIGPSSTTLTVASSRGGLFPSPTGGNFFLATLQEGAAIEIVKVTARSGDTMTIVRAQEGTSATTFTTNAVFDLRITAGGLGLFPQSIANLSSSSLPDGASLSGSVLTLGPADATNPGLMTASDQSFAGNKTFAGNLTPSSDLTNSVGSAANRWLAFYGSALRDGNSLSRFTFASGQGNAQLSAVADGGSAVAHALNTNTTLSTTGAKLLSVQNNSTEKLYVDKDGYLALVGSTGTVLLRELNGRLQAAEGGRPFALVASDFVNLMDPKYGAVGDGVADDSDAVQAWVNDIAGASLVGSGGYAPQGTYRLTKTITIPSTSGMKFVGAGRSTNFVWDGPAGSKVFDIKPGYFNSFFSFRISLPAPSDAQIPSHVLFMANPGPPDQPYAISGIKFFDVFIEAAQGSSPYGFYWEDTYGNGSEVSYYHMTITGCDIGVALPGTQQMAHNFFACEINTCNIGVRCGGGIANAGAGGSFQWYGGGISVARYAAVTVEYPTIPIELRGVVSEHCNRFMDSVPSTQSPPVGSRATQPIIIAACRLDTAADEGFGITPQYDSYLRLLGGGPYIIEGNTFNADEPLRIQMNYAGPVSLRLESNFFAASGAVAVSPLNFDDSLGVTRYGDIVMRGNRFRSEDGTISDQQRLEGLDTYVLAGPLEGGSPSLVAQNGRHYLLALPLPTAAATTQSIHILDLPLGTRVRVAGLHIHSRYALSGTPDITVALGTSSGGQELTLEQKVSVADGQRLGLTPDAWGAAMGPGGAVLDGFATTPLYVTWNSASGNLGTGSANSFTGGLGFIVLEAEQDARWLHNG